jgi:hypothetical protein
VIRLTQQLAEQIRLTSNEADRLHLQIDPASRNCDGLREALLHEFPQADLNDEKTGAPAIVFSAAIDTVNDPKRAPRGHVTVLAKGEGVALSASAKFVDKPWADDWTLFCNANSTKRYVMASSSQPGSSEREALDSARKQAVELLLPTVRSTMNANSAKLRGEKIIVTDDWIRDRLKYSIDSNASKLLIADTFVQKFERPYGDVWQASILIDASQPNIQLLDESYSRTARAQFHTRASAWTAMGGVAIVIGLLYMFANAVTRGYFMWRLRAVAILAAIAGVLVLFAAA